MAKKVLANIADVEEAMNELQNVTASLDIKTGKANQKIAEIRNGMIEDVASLEEQKKRLSSAIESWADAHREDSELFPNGKKSLDLQAGTISFRLGAPKVVLRKKIKMVDVIARAIENGFRKILTKPEPELDKKAVKDLYDDGDLTDDDLKTLGLDITQDESVKIDLNTVDSYK